MPAPRPSALPLFSGLLAWTQNTWFSVGERTTANGNVYVCVTAGTSAGAGTGPAGVGAGIADGTAVWDFVAALSTAWAPTTAYDTGDVVTNDGGKLYECITAGTSAGSGGPTGTAGVITDGTVTWTYVSTAISQHTEPTSRVKDIGLTPGSPLFAQYLNWLFGNRAKGIFGWLRYLQDAAAIGADIAATALTWTAQQTFALSAANETTAHHVFAEPTTRRFAGQYHLTGSTNTANIYNAANLEIVTNATWSNGTSLWTQTDAARASMRYSFDPTGVYTVESQAAGTAPWADGAWTSRLSFNDTGVMSITGRIGTLGAGNTDITSARDLSAGRDVLAVTNVTAINGNVAATAGAVSAGTTVTAGTKAIASTARSSATPGAGQAMAAGETWKDTSVFAYARILQTGANTISVTRSLNLASAPTEAVNGKYLFALQTAAPNGLIVHAQVVGAGIQSWTVRPDTLTTSAFQVWVGDMAGTVTEMAVNDELHVVVHAY